MPLYPTPYHRFKHVGATLGMDPRALTLEACPPTRSCPRLPHNILIPVALSGTTSF